ncbi:MAG: hypothetical protein WB460_21785 [Candidatus Acidiferrales bacterium]
MVWPRPGLGDPLVDVSQNGESAHGPAAAESTPARTVTAASEEPKPARSSWSA